MEAKTKNVKQDHNNLELSEGGWTSSCSPKTLRFLKKASASPSQPSGGRHG